MKCSKPTVKLLKIKLALKVIESKLVCLGIPALGMSILLLNLPKLNPLSNYNIIALMAMNLLADFLVVTLPNGVSVSLNFPVIFCALILFGPVGAMWVYVPVAIITHTIRKKGLFKLIYNISQICIAVFAAGTVLVRDSYTIVLTKDFLYYILAVFIFDFLNSVQVIKIITMQNGQRFFPAFKETWIHEMASVRPIYYATGIIMAICFQTQGIFGALLVATPVIGAFFQLNTQKELKSQTSRANTDALTGLANRYALSNWWEKRLPTIINNNTRLCVILIDIDDFKKINDLYGHNVGDQVLKMVSDVLQDCVRQTDCVFRYGGEEFILLLPDSNIQGAKQVANRIRSCITKASIKHLNSVSITISAGLTCLTDKLTSDEEDIPGKLIRQADVAMYMAKQNGKNQVQVFC